MPKHSSQRGSRGISLMKLGVLCSKPLFAVELSLNGALICGIKQKLRKHRLPWMWKYDPYQRNH